MTPCAHCGKTDDGRMTRGVCNACYQRVKKAGLLHTLAPKRPEGVCKRGHNLDEAGRDTRGACRVCSRQRSRERHAAKLAGEGREPVVKSFADGTCQRGHDVTDPGNIYVRGNGKRTCRQCALERSNPNAQRRIPAKRDPDRVRVRQKAAPKPPRAPKSNPQPKVETPKPKPVKAPKSKLPPGWDRVTPAKVHPKPGQAGHGGGGKTLEVPLTPELPAAIRRKAAARLLAMGAGDLLAALGLEDAA